MVTGTSPCIIVFLPASLRAADLLLHADGLSQEAVNIFEIHAAVGHASYGTVETTTKDQERGSEAI